MNRVIQHKYIFHPVTIILTSIAAAGIFALITTLLFHGELRWFLLYYFTPIGIPFVAFLFDRAEQRTLISTAGWTVDLIVLIPALMRAFVLIPFISGHALFLAYCLLTSRSKVAQITAFLVLMQVVYLKIFVMHDTTLFGGVIAGCLAAVVYRRVKPFNRSIQVESE